MACARLIERTTQRPYALAQSLLVVRISGLACMTAGACAALSRSVSWVGPHHTERHGQALDAIWCRIGPPASDARGMSSLQPEPVAWSVVFLIAGFRADAGGSPGQSRVNCPTMNAPLTPSESRHATAELKSRRRRAGVDKRARRAQHPSGSAERRSASGQVDSSWKKPQLSVQRGIEEGDRRMITSSDGAPPAHRAPRSVATR
jgi:hypothetical protein